MAVTFSVFLFSKSLKCMSKLCVGSVWGREKL
uniref:Uncharacterized protein n=1 Tax=Arundo donax TaxID=35708 RepID=A0A0A9HPJ2_ARUDO